MTNFRLTSVIIMLLALAPHPSPATDSNCCLPRDQPGCETAACAACVCEFDAFCCEDAWDVNCAQEAAGVCLESCPCSPPTPTPTPTATPGGDCCSEHPGPGCDSPECTACVCGKDEICCGGSWDTVCAEEAAGVCLENCPCRLLTPTPTPGGDCCTEHDGPGCDVGGCAACVCDIDLACCDQGWDGQCVDEAVSLCNEQCLCSGPPTPTPTPGGDCCSSHDGPGCDVEGCAACVCNIDLACCDERWDGLCVDEAASLCNELCSCAECLGDCDQSGTVSVNELVTGVNIALGGLALDACAQFDGNHDGSVSVDELVRAVNNALSGCALTAAAPAGH